MKRSKYGNKLTVLDGIKFHSKKEAGRYAELKLLERGGKIYGLRLQPRYPLMVDDEKVGTYVGDFFYFEAGMMAQRVVEDVKGYQTREFKLKWALCKALYPTINWRLV